MRLTKVNGVFNFYNTNGRRGDILEAYWIYLDILNELSEEGEDFEWSSYPDSLNQYRFYEKAIKASPEVFKNTNKYETFSNALKSNEKLYNAFVELDKESFLEVEEGKNLLKDLDKNLEARARHYTSNLTKIGFTIDNRKISEAGYDYLYSEDIDRTDFENVLSIDNVNLIVLRQLLKLRIFSKNYNMTYSPFLLLIALLLDIEYYESTQLINFIQTLTPNVLPDLQKMVEQIKLKEPVETIIEDYIDYSSESDYLYLMGKNGALIDFSTFKNIFKNRKSSKKIDSYYAFYKAIYNFNKDMNEENLRILYDTYVSDQDALNKAFGFNSNIFIFSDDSFNVSDFISNNNDNPFLNPEDVNLAIYNNFIRSKRYDQVYENSDTFKRLLQATGIFSFDSGIIRLKTPKIWEILFKDIDLFSYVFEKSSSEEWDNYNQNLSSYFMQSHTIDEIVESMFEVNIDEIVQELIEDSDVKTIEEVKLQQENKANDDFVAHIRENYPLEVVRELLLMFNDRSNDKKIQENTNSIASLPTIFEYLVGIAWYHISDEEYNVIESFNLSLDGDFNPIRFAGGGYGDIIVTYPDDTVMLEVTLMDANTQKRGELEPVSRHTVNLTVAEHPRPVTTIFLSTELDFNTVQNWRSQSLYPQRATLTELQGQQAEGIRILPLTVNEFDEIIENKKTSSEIIASYDNSLSSNPMDVEWRNDIIKTLVNN